LRKLLACHNGVRGARRRYSNLSPNCKPALHSGKRNGPPHHPDRANRADGLLPKTARPMIRVFGQDRIDLAYSDRRNREGPHTFHPSCVLARIAAHAEKGPRPRSKTMTKFFLLGLFGLQSAVMTAQAQVFDNLPITEAEKQWFDTSFVQSCCNLGDAFISDLYFEKDGHFYAEITDGFDHHPKVQRVIIPPGTIREIPPEIFNKMKTAPRNPTNHGIIFLYLSFDGLQGYRMTPQTGVLAVKPEEADVLCYWRGSGS
jgi:hypothetical protein